MSNWIPLWKAAEEFCINRCALELWVNTKKCAVLERPLRVRVMEAENEGGVRRRLRCVHRADLEAMDAGDNWVPFADVEKVAEVTAATLRSWLLSGRCPAIPRPLRVRKARVRRSQRTVTTVCIHVEDLEAIRRAADRQITAPDGWIPMSEASRMSGISRSALRQAAISKRFGSVPIRAQKFPVKARGSALTDAWHFRAEDMERITSLHFPTTGSRSRRQRSSSGFRTRRFAIGRNGSARSVRR
jgi:hypothetical protein